MNQPLQSKEGRAKESVWPKVALVTLVALSQLPELLKFIEESKIDEEIDDEIDEKNRQRLRNNFEKNLEGFKTSSTVAERVYYYDALTKSMEEIAIITPSNPKLKYYCRERQKKRTVFFKNQMDILLHEERDKLKKAPRQEKETQLQNLINAFSPFREDKDFDCESFKDEVKALRKGFVVKSADKNI